MILRRKHPLEKGMGRFKWRKKGREKLCGLVVRGRG